MLFRSEEAVRLAIQNGVALMRRDLNVYIVQVDGHETLLVSSQTYDSLWNDAFIALKKAYDGTRPLTLRPKVGIGVMVFRDKRVLMGRRKSSHGAGEWAWPGGHLEYMESFESCAKREVMEETGMEIENVRFNRLMNLKVYEPKHYVDVGLIADWKSGEPEIREPHKCDGWEWFSMDSLPTPRFSACDTAIEAYKTHKNYFDF